jgi:hypothetical protein
MLPIIVEMEDDIDLLHTQFYNNYSSTIAIDGRSYLEGSGDFVVAITESILYGFDLPDGRGNYYGFDADKFAIGLPAGLCSAGRGYTAPEEITKAIDYLRGNTEKPEGWKYDLIETYPELRGLMTWSINGDARSSCSGEWTFAEGFKDAFPEDVQLAVGDKAKEVSFSIYPNPVVDEVHISTEVAYSTVVIYSISGKKIESFEIGREEVIDFSKFEKGMYLIKINGSVQKVIKQ